MLKVTETNNDEVELHIAVHTSDDLLEALDVWASFPVTSGLTLSVRGVTLDFPNGLTKQQFDGLADYALVLDQSGAAIN